MKQYYYTKKGKTHKKLVTRIIATIFLICGFFILTYILFPLFSWQLYFQPNFTTPNTSPVPKNKVVNSSTFQTLIASASDYSTDFNDANNWFPGLKKDNLITTSQTPNYLISIPAIDVKNAVVSTTDYNLSEHLVNYIGTAIPPENGTSVIFGHSTLPQLYNPKDYKTIFANVFKLKTGDTITTLVDGVTYQYKIFDITIVDPDDTSMFSQTYNNSYLTLITCTPPGTIWKRLVVKARLEKI